MVVCPEHLQEVAKEVLVYAENALEKVCAIFKAQPPSKIRYLLHDFNDRANGSATFFPYNQIEIRYAPPDQESSLAGAIDWLNQLVVHETTHVVLFHQAPKGWLLMRKFFGHNPLLYPAALMPRWMMEGLAIISESMFSNGGRLDTGDYGMMLNTLAGAKCMPSWRDFWGVYTRWPGPQAAYLFGAGFLSFLSGEQKHGSLERIVQNYKKHPIPVQFLCGFIPWPYTSVNRFNDIFGLNIGDAWSQYLTKLGQNVIVDRSMGQYCFPIESSIEEKRFPLITSDGDIFFWGYDYRKYPGIYQMVDGKARKLISVNGISGLDGDTDRLVFSAYQLGKTYRNISDIYVFNRRTKRLKRITHGARISYPNLRGNRILGVQKQSDGSMMLIELSLETKKIDVLGLSAENLAHPMWSPDGTKMTVSVKNKGERWRIACLKPGGPVLFAPVTAGNQFNPVWEGQDRILFLAENNPVNELFSWSFEEDKTVSLDGVKAPPTIRAFAQSHIEDGLLALWMSGSGYVLGKTSKLMTDTRMVCDEIPVSSTKQHGKSVDMKQGNGLSPRNYRFINDMFPKYVSFGLRDGGSAYQPGVVTSGHDLTMRHQYNAELYWDFQSQSTGVRLSYRYDGLKPTLGLDYYSLPSSSHLNLQGNEGIYTWRETRWRLFSQWWFLQGRRWRWDVLFGFAAGRFSDGSTITTRTTSKSVGLFSQVQVGNLCLMLDAIAPQGIAAAVGVELWPTELGASYSGVKLSARGRLFQLVTEDASSAIQINVSHFWGERPQFLAMGGSDGVQNSDILNSDLFGLNRAFPAGSFWGRGGWLLNSELRFSVKKVEKNIGLLGTVNRVLFSLFADIGNMWLSQPIWSPRISLGAELTARIQLSELPLEMGLGLAFPLEKERGARVYLRIGPSF